MTASEATDIIIDALEGSYNCQSEVNVNDSLANEAYVTIDGENFKITVEAL